MSEKMFPLQTDRHSKPGPTRISWNIAEKAYGAYAARYGKSQSLEELARRGGFGWNEMDLFYPAWREESDEIVQLRAEIAALRAEVERLKADNAKLTYAVVNWMDTTTAKQ